MRLASVIRFSAVMSLVASGTALAGIEGTAHDLATSTWTSVSTTEICVFCHTPHDAQIAINAALWNRAASSAASYTVYTGADINATIGQPGEQSEACLGCHDGTIAIDSVHNAPGTETWADTAGNRLDATDGAIFIGTDLTDDHPVGFTYDSALSTADGGLYDPASVTAVNDLLFGGQMECASCHDVHDNTNGSFLVASNESSDLCLTCHNK